VAQSQQQQPQQRQQPQPQSSGGNGLPPDLKFYSPFPFKGVDIKGAVTAIDDDSFAWLENILWIGKGQLAFGFSNNTAIYAAPGVLTIVSYGFYQLNGVPYIGVFLSDGSAQGVSLSGAVVNIAPAGTFSVVTPPCITSWIGKWVLIGTHDAYYIWDGTSIFGPGTVAPDIAVTSGGFGYTSAPTVTITGGTGRFAGASGQLTIYARITSVSIVGSTETITTVGFWVGSISYPGR